MRESGWRGAVGERERSVGAGCRRPRECGVVRS